MEAIRVLQADGQLIRVQADLRAKTEPALQRRPFQVWAGRIAARMSARRECRRVERRS